MPRFEQLSSREDNQVRGTWFIIALALAGSVSGGSEADLADAHRTKHYPKDEWIYHGYLSYASVPKAQRDEMKKVVAFVFASTSRQSIIEYCVPKPVNGSDTLYHFAL